jgi:hypothetical protein
MEIKMDKVKLEFKIPEKTIVEYNNVKIEIIPFLSFAEQVFLINRYLQEYFDKTTKGLIPDSEYNYFEAEFGLKNSIFQTITNIDTVSLDNDIYADSALWKTITSKIINYYSFMDNLNHILEEIKAQNALNNSLGKVIADLSVKIRTILDNLPEISPQQIENLQKGTEQLADKLKEVSALGGKPPVLAPNAESKV